MDTNIVEFGFLHDEIFSFLWTDHWVWMVGKRFTLCGGFTLYRPNVVSTILLESQDLRKEGQTPSVARANITSKGDWHNRGYHSKHERI
jgi:hypothetical protein